MRQKTVLRLATLTHWVTGHFPQERDQEVGMGGIKYGESDDA
jgi:hypothetical protein